MIRMLVVDDHLPTRLETIQKLTEGGTIEIVGQAETSEQALALADKLLPDIVLLDLHLPGLRSPSDLIKRLTDLRNVKVIAFASQSRFADVQDLLDAGAFGYLLKSDPPTLIRMAILMVFRGHRNITSPALPRHLTKLTAQERNFLKELTKRGNLPKTAERMGIAEAALNETIEQLCQKLELSNPEKLIKWAKKHGF